MTHPGSRGRGDIAALLAETFGAAYGCWKDWGKLPDRTPSCSTVSAT